MKFKLLMLLLLSMIAMSNTYAQWTQTNGPEGGVVNCLTKVGNEIWMGSQTGIYVSDYYGYTWGKSTFLENRAIGAIFSTGDTIVIQYAERDSDNSWAYHLKIISSFDMGITWTLPFEIESDSGTAGAHFYHCQGGLVYQRFSTTLVSGDMGLNWTLPERPVDSLPVYYIIDSLAVLAQQDNILYKSEDLTQSWTYQQTINHYIWYFDDSLMFGLYRNDTLPPGNVYFLLRSVSSSLIWDTVFTFPDNVYPYKLLFDNNIFYLKTLYDVNFRSVDYGQTWQPFATPVHISSIQYNLDNDQKLFADGEGLSRYIESQNMILPANTGFNARNIQALYATESKLICFSDSYVFVSSDGGQQWVKSNVKTNFIFNQWQLASQGDTIVMEDYKKFYRSFNGGITWEILPLPDSSYCTSFGLVIKNSRIYLSRVSQWYSDDWGLTWSVMPDIPVYTASGPGNYDKNGFLGIHKTFLYAATAGGYLFKYNESASTWEFQTFIVSGNMWDDFEVYSMDSLLMFGGDGGFKYSTDDGNSWIQPLNNGVPTVWQGVLHPRSIRNFQGVWIGCNQYGGMFSSTDNGNNWAFTQLPHGKFDPVNLIIANGKLYSASFYSSIWQREDTITISSGTVYYDQDNNGTKDPGEFGINHIGLFANPSHWMSSSDSSGNFYFMNDVDQDTLRIINPQPLATVNPPWRLITGTSTNQDFGIYLEPGIADLSIDLTNANFFRPGFDTYLTFTVLNKGSVNQSPLIQFIKPDLTDFISAIPAPLSINGDTLTWQLGSLGFLEQNSIKVILNTPVGTPLGTAVYAKATAFPVIGDTIPEDNVSVIYDVVRASYDPNDKTCLQGDFFTPAAVAAGEDLEFIIRFQNLGTLATEFVRITDTLSPYLDWSTFRFVSSSHPVRWSLHGRGIVEFLFDPLALPPASLDELGSMGFVKYAIRCKPEVQIGTAIANTAHIFFDFNPAVITNTTTTLIANIYTSISEPLETTSSPVISIYPNPAASFLTIDIRGEMKAPMCVVIHDFSGRQVHKSNLEQSRTQLSLVEWPAGFYIGGVFDQHGRRTGVFKFILNPH